MVLTSQLACGMTNPSRTTAALPMLYVKLKKCMILLGVLWSVCICALLTHTGLRGAGQGGGRRHQWKSERVGHTQNRMRVSPLSFLLPFLLNLGATAETTQWEDEISDVVVNVKQKQKILQTQTINFFFLCIHLFTFWPELQLQQWIDWLVNPKLLWKSN